nr:MAG TPA: hypothetical protein [Caudoviricetes sp.]
MTPPTGDVNLLQVKWRNLYFLYFDTTLRLWQITTSKIL